METSYRGLDYDSGKAIQTLRGRTGLTQVGLAEHLGVSVRTVKEWEAGGSYLKAERLKALIVLAIQYRAFPKGCEAEEIRALWQITRQKRLLDEDWLATLLADPPSPQVQGDESLRPDTAPHTAPLQGATPMLANTDLDALFTPQEQSLDALPPYTAPLQGTTPVLVNSRLDALRPHVAPPHRVTLVPGGKSLDAQFSLSGLEVEAAGSADGGKPRPYAITGQRRVAAGQAQNRARMLRQLGGTYRELMSQSLQGTAWLELGLTYKPDATQNAANLLWRVKRGREEHLPAGTSIAQVYDEAGYELLILGAPGAGKSTLLLDLAHHLVVQAQADETHPLPMILPLSTWAQKRLPLSDWIVEQMHEIYDVPRTLGAQWVREEAILPLLDGLDEVEETRRLACIEQINAYHSSRHLPLVVCTRLAEYEAASEHKRLKLRSAVAIQPLTQAQVERYLVQMGEPLSTLHTTLQEYPALLELATTPLMLNVLILTYREMGVDHLPETQALLQEQVWTDYVARMVERKGEVRRYPHARTVAYLHWLAQQMQRRNQTVFYLEHLQPDWLDARGQRIYRWWAVRLPGILVGILVSLAITIFIGAGEFDSMFLFQSGLLGALLGTWYTSNGQARNVEMGCEETLSLTSAPSLTQDQKKPWHRSWKHMAISLFIGLLFACSVGLDDYGSPRQWLYDGIVFFIAFTPAVFLLQYLQRKLSFNDGALPLHHQTGRWQRLVHPFQTVHAKRFLIVATVIGLSHGLSYGLVAGLNYGYGLNSGLINGLDFGVQAGLIFGLSSVSVGFILGVQAGRIHLTERLRWTFRSLCRGLSLSKHVHVIYPLTSALFLFMWLSYWAKNVASRGLGNSLVSGQSIGLAMGLSVGLGYWLLSGLFQGIMHERIKDQDRRVPNQGIRRSLQNSMIMGSISGGIIGGVGMLSMIAIYTLGTLLNISLKHGMSYDILTYSLHFALSQMLDQQRLCALLLIALFGGLLVCMGMGGLAVWRHYVMRLLLWRSHAFPGRAPRFLNDACTRFLLRRVGGGYSFMHRLLLDYFVARWEEDV